MADDFQEISLNLLVSLVLKLSLSINQSNHEILSVTADWLPNSDHSMHLDNIRVMKLTHNGCFL